GFTSKISKGLSGWCDPVIESIDVQDIAVGQLQSAYSQLNGFSTNGDVIVGMVPHPDNVKANVALKVLSPDGLNDQWESEIVSSSRQSTAGHQYGRAIL